MRDVAFSCDDNGAKFLRVTVWSLLKHYKGAEPIRINVFEGFGGHSAENKQALAEVIAKFPNASVRYIDIESAVAPYADLIMRREKSRWNVFTWTPIFTPMLLADATGNVAHFDIDMLFNDDVSKILDLNLGDNLIAAVAEYGKGDPVITEAVWGKGILPPEAERYFNTGTIVFNTAKCREERTWEKILAWYRDHYEIADRIEQDAWNALYWTRTKLLPLRWNFHDRLVRRFAKADLFSLSWQGNPPRECLEAALSPAILHFWGPKKPWKPSHRPYRGLYHEAMRAVGQVPPREQRLGAFHDLMTRWDFSRIRRKQQALAPENFRALAEKCWARHLLRKRMKAALLVPFEWFGIALFLLLVLPLPRKGMQALCDLFSAVYFILDGKGRRFALENLRLMRRSDVSPAWERKILRRSYRNMVRTVGYAFWTVCRARARCAATGELGAALRAFGNANRPFVGISGHIGCWEMLSQLFILEGHQVMSVAKGIGTSGMTALLMRARRSIGQEIVSAEGALKHLMAGIRAGSTLGLLVDQKVDPDKGGIWIRFLGKPMPVSAAPAFFSAKAKVPIAVTWSRPLRNGRYRCELFDVIAPEKARDIWTTTQRIATDLERIVRRHPSCWVLNYNYFSHIPSEDDLRTLKQREAGA